MTFFDFSDIIIAYDEFIFKRCFIINIVIDRFENGTAICLDDSENAFGIIADKLPPNALEGDVLIAELSDNGCITILGIDNDETILRRKRINDLFEKLKNRSVNNNEN